MWCEHSLLLLVMVLYEIGDFEKSNKKQTLLSYVLLFITVCFLKKCFLDVVIISLFSFAKLRKSDRIIKKIAKKCISNLLKTRKSGDAYL